MKEVNEPQDVSESKREEPAPFRVGDWVRLTEAGREAQRAWLNWSLEALFLPESAAEVAVGEQGVLLWLNHAGVWTVRFDKQTLCLREEMMEAA